MNKFNLVFISSLVLIIIFGCVSCGVTKDIYIGYEYPNFVKDEPVEIKVGEKIRFKQDDGYGYMIVIEKANEFLDIDSVNLVIGLSGLSNRSFSSKPILVDKKGTGEYLFRVLCREEKIWSPEPSKVIIKSE
ncbi:MAG: hypothetical protein IH618_08150 [Ignavibacteriaceae bacterium]|nr:hypothetical protein [Ignavibacteriaceae bacterium]